MSPPLGAAPKDALESAGPDECLEFGCVAAHGTVSFDQEDGDSLTLQDKPATAFLLELIARLQEVATVPMIDVRAYSSWLR